MVSCVPVAEKLGGGEVKMDEVRDLALAMGVIGDDDVKLKLLSDTVDAIYQETFDALVGLGLSNDDGDIGDLAWWDKNNVQIVLPERLESCISGMECKSGSEEDGYEGVIYVYWNGMQDRAYKAADKDVELLMRIVNTAHATKCYTEEE